MIGLAIHSLEGENRNATASMEIDNGRSKGRLATAIKVIRNGNTIDIPARFGGGSITGTLPAQTDDLASRGRWQFDFCGDKTARATAPRLPAGKWVSARGSDGSIIAAVYETTPR